MYDLYLTNVASEASSIEKGGMLKKTISLDKINDIFISVSSTINTEDVKVFRFENYCIIFDGEIYNSDEITSILFVNNIDVISSTNEELFIKLYSILGQDAFNKINGVFSVIIYDVASNEIICVRDKLGFKPLYYTWNNDEIQISSKIKPLIKNKMKISKESISIYLSCGYIPSPYTIFSDISKLQAGCFLKFDLNKKTKEIKKYWDLPACNINNLSYEEAKYEVHELLKNAVKLRINTQKSFGCFLSGGIDSALITAIAADLVDFKIKTFTIGFNEPGYDESDIASQFSEILGTEHYVEILTKENFVEMLPSFIEAYDEPFADSSALPTLLLNKAASKQVQISLAGDGGDESFLGYSHFDSLNKFEKLDRIPHVFRNMISNFLPKNNRFKHILSIQDENKFIERIFIGNQELIKNINTDWLDISYSTYKLSSSHPIQKAADLNIKLSLENDSNVKVERASQFYGMEVRSPFLDYRIVEFARNLPVEYRFSDGVRKRILRDILETYIPRNVFEQPKKGFSIPLADWLRTVLKSDLESQLNDSALRAIPNLNVKEFKKMLDSHFKGEKDYSSFIWRVYVLVLWINKNKAQH